MIWNKPPRKVYTYEVMCDTHILNPVPVQNMLYPNGYRRWQRYIVTEISLIVKIKENEDRLEI